MGDGAVIIPADVLADTDLSSEAKILLGYLLALAPAGGVVFRGRAGLGVDLGLAERRVEAALRQLERAGRIALAVSHGGRGRPRGWRVLAATPGLAALKRPAPVHEAPSGKRRYVQPCLFDTGMGRAKEGLKSPASGSL